MKYDDWNILYEEILSDFGYDRISDENSARLLKSLTLNSNLISEEELSKLVGKEVTVFGGADSLSEELKETEYVGTLVSAGSATETLISKNIVPDIVVTDLDGDVESQIEASNRGSVTLIHAHGDNADAIMKHAHRFRGKIMITTQSKPDLILNNFGGFTDGDRAVCMAKHFGAETINLVGFDFENPSKKNASENKRKKLRWAKKIIERVTQ